jgi:hypothetical protein
LGQDVASKEALRCTVGHALRSPALLGEPGEWRLAPGAQAGDLFCSRCGCFVQSYLRRPDPLWEPLPQLCNKCVWEVPGGS